MECKKGMTNICMSHLAKQLAKIEIAIMGVDQDLMMKNGVQINMIGLNRNRVVEKTGKELGGTGVRRLPIMSSLQERFDAEHLRTVERSSFFLSGMPFFELYIEI